MQLKPENGTLMMLFVGATSVEHNLIPGNRSKYFHFMLNALR